MSVLESLWPQWGHLPWSPQNAQCGGSCSQVCTLLLLHYVRHPPWLLVNHPWPGLQLVYNFQQSLWKISFPVTSLWPGLLWRHHPEEDGSHPWRIPRMYWNCRQHHCPWPHRGRTWCLPVISHADCLQIQLGVQTTEDTHEGPSHQLQVNASHVGLGSALLQNGKPIAFASKTLTKTEWWYTNIEREMLAAVFGVERFHTYIYGWSFTIKSNHKLLESISRKNLAETPAQLQCMMLHLQGYDFTIHYHPGKEMVIPDTLSQFSPQTGPDLPLNIAIHHVHTMPDHKEAFHQAFVNDPEMWALAGLTVTGWPEDIKEVTCPLYPYWQHRETLTVEDSLVLQGEGLIILPAERERVLHQLHQFHQGITKSQLLAHGSFFWPSINKAIEEVVCQYEACTQFQSQNAAASLTPTPTPSCPWQMCVTDYLHTRWNWPPGSGWLLLKDDLCSMAFHLARATPTRSSCCWKRCFQSMASLKSFTLTMANNMQVPSLLTSVCLGA